MSFGGREAVAAATIVRVLKGRFGLHGWVDQSEIKGGDAWFTLINAALRNTSAFVLCIGDAPISFWCEQELAAAMNRHKHDPAYRVVLVFLPGASVKDIPLVSGLAGVRIANPADPAQLAALAGALQDGDPRPPPFDWIEALRQAGIAQTAAELAVVQHKYIDRLYVPRTTTLRQLGEFLASDALVFLLLGEAGVGKTNFVCDFARREGAHRPVLFLRASTLGLGLNAIEAAIVTIVETNTGQRIGSPVFPLLTELAQGSRLLVVLDAINEAQSPAQLAEALGATLHRARTSSTQFLLTCRRADWRFFQQDPRITSSIWRSQGRDQSVGYGHTLARFSTEELENAWALYKPYFSIKGHLTDSVRAVCDHPLMLRFLCEAYRDRLVPPVIKTIDVFNEYWDTKVDHLDNRRSRAALMRLALRLRATRRTTIIEDDMIGMMPTEAYNHLLSEDIILLTYVDPHTRARVVGFMYEAFFEYCVARAVLAEEEWHLRGPKEVMEGLADLLREAESNRAMVGVIEFILLFYQNHENFDEFLDSVDVSSEWRHSICVLLPRLEHYDRRHLARLSDYVRDESYWVRWAAAFALAQLPNATAFFEAVEAWFADDQWQAREGAANALAHRPFDVNRWSRLVYWADDVSWRVRRAIALCINRCLAAGVVPFGKLEELARDNSWRRRDVAVISQRDLDIAPESSRALLEPLMHDQSERVRFDLAKFLSTIRSTVVLPMLRVLAEDRSPWVRRRVAKSAVRFVPYQSGISVDILGMLTRDRDRNVRWEVARVLAGPHALHDRLGTALEELKRDPDESVRAAAEFSSRHGIQLVSMDFDQVLLACDGRPLDIREAVARVEDALRPPREIAEKQYTAYASWRPDHYPGIVRAITLVAERTAQANFLSLLRLLLLDPEEGVRWAMAQMVVTLGTDLEVRGELARSLLADPHVWVRQAMLEELTPAFLNQCPDVGPSLITLLDDEDTDLRLALVLAAERLRNELHDLADHILGQLQLDSMPEVAQAAIRGNGRRQ